MNVSQAVFAATLIALGILGLIRGDYTPIWRPAPTGLPPHEFLAYLCAGITLACGVGLQWPRAAAIAGRVLLASLLLWTVFIKLPEVFPAPMALGSWFGVSETFVLVAAAWILYVARATDWDKRHLNFATGIRGLRIATVLYGLALIHFGLAHFVYVDQTTVLVPGWLPSHLFWAYFTGAAYITAGASILIGRWSRLAAILSAVQIAGFTFLVWIPIVAAGSKDEFQWSETILSWALTSAAWVLADSYRNAASAALASDHRIH